MRTAHKYVYCTVQHKRRSYPQQCQREGFLLLKVHSLHHTPTPLHLPMHFSFRFRFKVGAESERSQKAITEGHLPHKLPWWFILNYAVHALNVTFILSPKLKGLETAHQHREQAGGGGEVCQAGDEGADGGREGPEGARGRRVRAAQGLHGREHRHRQEHHWGR